MRGGLGNHTISGATGADTVISELSTKPNVSGDDTITDDDTAEGRLLLGGDVLGSLTDTGMGGPITPISGGSILVKNVLAVDICPSMGGLVKVL